MRSHWSQPFLLLLLLLLLTAMLAWVSNFWTSTLRPTGTTATATATATSTTSAALDLDTATADNCAWFGLPSNALVECKVIDVYDGDTITVVLPFCDRLFKSKCRLMGIDSPEIRTKNAVEKAAAILARDWLRAQILNQRVFLQCRGYDKYGRLLADVFKERGCFQPSINVLLVENGHAVAYDGGTKKAFSVSDVDVH